MIHRFTSYLQQAAAIVSNTLQNLQQLNKRKRTERNEVMVIFYCF